MPPTSHDGTDQGDLFRRGRCRATDRMPILWRTLRSSKTVVVSNYSYTTQSLPSRTASQAGHRWYFERIPRGIRTRIRLPEQTQRVGTKLRWSTAYDRRWSACGSEVQGKAGEGQLVSFWGCWMWCSHADRCLDQIRRCDHGGTMW